MDFKFGLQYRTGPLTAKKAIMHVYDLFGYTNQTFQGADMLSTQGKEPYLVLMPDFIGSRKAAKLEWFEPGADKQALHNLIADVTSKEQMDLIAQVVGMVQSDPSYAHVQRWAGAGFCWGAKGLSLIASNLGKPRLDVLALTSPSRLDPEDAKSIAIPTMVLDSQGEEEQTIRDFMANLTGVKYRERFDEIHGWMSARAKLDLDRPRKEYERGYELMLDFLQTHL
ncbi:hypothetical protein RBB50_000275 [Rhinocladiella similis]